MSLTESIREPLLIIWGDRRGRTGLIIILTFMLMAIVGPEILPLDLSAHTTEIFLPPSLKHPLGTDYAGRDVLMMLINGSRDMLLVGFLAALYTVLIGFSVGITSGFIGGRIDSMLMMLVDTVLTIPSFPLLILIASYIRGTTNPFMVAAVMSITSWAGLSRAIRSQVLSLKEREFIEASKTLGLSTRHIIFQELLPNMLSYIMIRFIYSMVGAIYAFSGLFFLGIVPFTSTNWGWMINSAISQGGIYLQAARHYLLAPVISLVLLQTGLVFLSAGMEKVFNPRLRTE